MSKPATSGKASGAPAGSPPPHQMSAWKASLLILMAFCLAGVIPLAILASVTDHFGLTLPSTFAPFAGFSSAPTSTDAPDLALPRDSWTTRTVDVLPRAGQGAAVATLAPGFPVKLLQHQRVGNTLWSRIEWDGPVTGAGGAGWAPDSAFVAYGQTGAIFGDLGALAPSLREAVAPAGKSFAAAVYIPSQDRLYNAGSLDGVFALGTGVRPMLLSALFAGAESDNKPVSLTDELPLSHGDANTATRIYQQLGGATGLSVYLSSHSVAGFQFAPLWTACHATPRATVDFYTQLAGDLLNTKDRASVISILSLADAASTSKLAASWAGAAGNLLVVGVAPTDNTFTVSVAGILNPPQGPQLIVAAVATNQPSTDAALQIMKSFYTPLTTLFGQ
ncbi:MAG TPA: hypothetical protein VFQ32_09280 [Ktedonobacterales bacterium]|nr:hypothetical protein [Ktedonobacterales bacterium]